MNAAVAYFLANELSGSGSPHPRPPKGSGEPRRALAALLAAVALALTAALGVAFGS